MNSQYSEPLHAGIYNDDPAFTSIFRPRIHKQKEIADHASVRCNLDFNGPEHVGINIGNLNPHAGNWVALCAPNCLPERLPLVAYVMEYGFLHDDEIDNAADQTFLLNENKKLLDALNETGCSSSLTIHSDSTRRRSEVQAKIAAECFRLDPMFGRQFILIWEAFMQSTGLGDVGARWAICMLGWGTGIHLTPDEERTIAPISDVAYAALALTNDLFSWEKELKSHLESKGQVPLVNAVHVVMASNNVTERTAKAVVKEEIRAHEEQFSLLRKQYMATTDRSQSVISWLQLLQDTMAGNMAWSLKTPRYSKTIQNPYKDHFKASTKDVISILGHYTGPVISDICDRS